MREAGGPRAAGGEPRHGEAARSAAMIAADLVLLFERVDGMPDKVRWVYERLAADLPGAQDPVLHRACETVASAIDAQAGEFDRNPYHNRQHFCEVVLTVHALACVNGLDTRATQFLLLAALIHDLVHDGTAHPAFVQERASIERARPLLAAAGLSALEVSRLAALVLATDISRGTGCMSAACDAHARADEVAIDVPHDAPELAALFEDPHLAMLARLLCEADVLPSIGLGLEHAMRLQQRLAHEWGRPLDAADKRGFIEHVLRQNVVGTFFLPNVHATQQALAAGADDEAGAH